MNSRIKNIVFALVLVGTALSCSTSRKASELRKEMVGAKLVLPQEESFMPDLGGGQMAAQRDTLMITGLDGEQVLIMKAIKDDDGNMVAHEVLDAAIVTARFRNVAERSGSVDIEFQVIVPEQMQDGKWQLRFYPDMYIMEDSVRLDPVVITGRDYRKAQLRGYEQYEKFLSSIINDPNKFVNIDMLEIFLKRNLPDVFAFKTDSSFVTDQMFYSYYGLNQQEIVDHYTNKFAKRKNERRMARRDRMYRKYIKAPIVTEGLRLDTVMQNINGDFVYNYVQNVHTRPKLRKVDIVLSGAIYEEDKLIYDVPRSEPLTFYISSLSAFVDNTERYMTKVIERRAEANTECYIDFSSGKYQVDERLGKNAEEIKYIKDNLGLLMDNQEFDLDSIVVVSFASPEGAKSYNESLSRKRSESISNYFDKWIKNYSDSLDAERGFAVDEEGRIIKEKRVKIRFKSRAGGENWDMLDEFVTQDTVMTDKEKEAYFASARISNIDIRERTMQGESYYKRLREVYYPRLRTVKFNFYLHRKGMVKDTVHTTELDTLYMKGVQAIRDRDYETAIQILRPYNDYNTAIAYVSLDYNASAMAILEDLERTAQVNYMLAVLYSRKGDDQNAVQCYLHSCEQDPSYIHRGNLDPEISALIKRYGLNQQPEDEFDYSF